jgi:hypothetical protein
MTNFNSLKDEIVGALVPIILRARKDLKKRKKGWWYFTTYIMKGAVEARNMAQHLEKEDHETTSRIQGR